MNTEKSTNRGARPRAPQGNVNRPPVRRRLTREEWEERKRREEARRKERREVFLARLSVVLVIYAVACILIAGLVTVIYRGNDGGGTSVQILGKDGKAVYTEQYVTSYKNGTQYISATGLSKLYDFTLAGDSKQVTMYFHNIGEKIAFTDDSCVVEINGERRRLSTAIIFQNDYYIPVELIKNYFNGVKIGRSKAGAVTLAKEGRLSLRSFEQTDTEPS